MGIRASKSLFQQSYTHVRPPILSERDKFLSTVLYCSRNPLETFLSMETPLTMATSKDNPLP